MEVTTPKSCQWVFQKENPMFTRGQGIPLVFQPGMSLQRSFAPVPIIVQQLLASFNVSGGHQDEVGDAADVVELRLTIPTLAVIHQTSQAVGLLCGIDTKRWISGKAEKKQDSLIPLVQSWVAIYTILKRGISSRGKKTWFATVELASSLNGFK